MADSFSAAPSTELILSVTDQAGKTAHVRFWLTGVVTDPTASAVTAMATALQNLTDGVVSKITLVAHGINISPTAAGTGAYMTAKDKGKLEFKSADGSRVTIQVPAPIDTIYLAGTANVYIDPANTAVKAMTDYVIAHCLDTEGNAITAVERLFRTRPANRKNQQ